MEYVYPAVFHPNNDGSYTIHFPDLPGCVSEGKSMPNALYMAQSGLKQFLEYLIEKNMEIPSVSSVFDVELEPNEFANLVRAEIKEERSVRRNVSIPKWMDDEVSEAGLSLSRVLQDALVQRLR